MPKRSSKKSLKVKSEITTPASLLTHKSKQKDVPVGEKEKNPAAVALGRLGGIKGGKARAEKLSAKRRSQIARAAAIARWSRQP